MARLPLSAVRLSALMICVMSMKWNYDTLDCRPLTRARSRVTSHTSLHTHAELFAKQLPMPLLQLLLLTLKMLTPLSGVTAPANFCEQLIRWDHGQVILDDNRPPGSRRRSARSPSTISIISPMSIRRLTRRPSRRPSRSRAAGRSAKWAAAGTPPLVEAPALAVAPAAAAAGFVDTAAAAVAAAAAGHAAATA